MSKPWVESGLPQQKTNDPGLTDLYKSPNVFINNVPVVLYQPPSASAGSGSSSSSPKTN